MYSELWVLLIVAAAVVFALWAIANGIFMGMNVVYGGICWFGISLVVWATFILGYTASTIVVGYLLGSGERGYLVGFALFAVPWLAGLPIGNKLVPLLSVDVFGRGPVWRWRVTPNDVLWPS
ncbi:hypothetical protein A3C18_01325 [Candidatus Kaiserbacteria bacterium RIFCSPHIGHO2_02_FULL_54_11b]|uniref:Uncharacterized protein n=2 Tax=Candidatus Kaiseribacteriota TaxID=1752734 RepID=A0A1F6CMW1_9BACT|nr:MAG: hypothetical protein A2704_02875 [Candidatus Kaiserbacteria bacterium RIFCSPHIGHO2_01_FULL_54_36b]OGG64350.1 MAG: hypothetical protein A3C18_01325 [Candidatus Kaiserbacteria bacterium RIFCSPHIGHO2_02_FULL_54_11b]